VADADGVIAVSAQGTEAWHVRHASLRSRPGERLVGPVVVAGHTLYAVRADLLEVDLGHGAVVRRTRFPAAITAINPARDTAPGTPQLEVTVEYRGVAQPAATMDRVVIRHRLGDPGPGRTFWSGRDWLGAWTDARDLVPELKPDGADPARLTPEARDRGIAALREAAARDLTNPHYLTLLGALLQAAGQGAEARRAFAAAADSQGAHWADLLRVSSTLEDAGAREPARRAFARGLRAVEAAGVRPERLRTAVAVALLMPAPRKALGEALKAKDVARVDEIAARTARLFPQAEGGAYAWARLTTWLREQGKTDVAARWEERARHGGTVFGADPRRNLAAEVDARFPFLLGCLLGAALVAFAVGLRRGGTSRTQDGPAARVPLPRPADVVIILLPLLAALALDLGISDRLATIGRYAGAPMGLFDDAPDAPDVERWVKAHLEPSPARDLLLAWVVEEGQATRAGGRSVTPPLDQSTCHAAIEFPGSLGTRLRRSLAGSMTSLATQITATGGKAGPFGAIRGVTGAALAALGLFVLGFVLARLFPLAQALAWLVPGGARSLSIPAGLVTALAAAGVCGNAYPAVLSHVALPNVHKLYGLETIVPPDGGGAATAPVWVFGALGIALVLHVWGVVRDVKRKRAKRAHVKPPQPSDS
jgi:hypothetical protein